MLTDIFARRYENTPLWDGFEEEQRRLLVQSFRIVLEQLFPVPATAGTEQNMARMTWTSIHDRLSMELGVNELSARGYLTAGNQWHINKIETICRGFVQGNFTGSVPADRFIKERLSFIELAFRDKENVVSPAAIERAIQAGRDYLRGRGAVALQGMDVREQRMREENQARYASFTESVNELNERFRQAGARLNYHNGFIQVAADEQVEVQIETPFWALVNAPKWANVDTDMKESIDRRDAGGRDPAFYAAKALESTIKIISDEKRWTRGDERGAANFIDNLVSQRNGRFISVWEGDALKAFFGSVRNELGHGPGGEPMPQLTPQQTDWAIEFCMSWVKSLIRRM